VVHLNHIFRISEIEIFLQKGLDMAAYWFIERLAGFAV
jgi:hypothetical protein